MAGKPTPARRRPAASDRFIWEPGQFRKELPGDDFELSNERAAQILMEETVEARTRTTDRTDSEIRYRRAIRIEVKEMKEKGIELVVPTDQPDPTEPD